MGRPTKIFLHFLTDPQGNCYYTDAAGNVKKGTNVWLDHSPKEWRDQELSWGRNTAYYGYNRTFTNSYSFVEDGAAILRKLMYGGHGLEESVYLVVLKWNPDTDVYEPYYKAEVDLSQEEDSVATDFKTNLLEGGLPKLLKAYEGTQFSIPMDGSLPEHFKVNVDGILFDDIYHYTFIPISSSGVLTSLYSLPIVFVNNDGDSIGVYKQDQNYDNIESGSLHTNFQFWKAQASLFGSESLIQIRITGNITVKRSDAAGTSDVSRFSLFTVTQSLNGSTDAELTATYGSLVNRGGGSNDPNLPVLVGVAEQKTYFFDKTITNPADFKTLIGAQGTNFTIVAGSINIQFSSKYKATQPWCLTARDVFKYLIKNICDEATIIERGEMYNYETQSILLDKEWLGLSLTSGDALRASADPNYQKYFNPTSQLGGTNTLNNYTSFGPVMKTSLKDFFTSINSITNASMGTEIDELGRMIAFVENKAYVFNSASVDKDLGEVSNLKVTLAKDYIFDEINIGYPAQQYDEKAGKFEYNTTLKMRSPVKKIQNTLSLISPYRADSYGVEYTRFNTTKDAKSTTYNNSDGSVFILNADRAKQGPFDPGFYDRDSATLEQGLVAVPGSIMETLPQTHLTGTYLQLRNDISIFVFKDVAQTNTTKTLTITYAALITGLISDYLIIEFIVSGEVIDRRKYALATPNLNQAYIAGTPEGETFTITLPNTLYGTAWMFRVTCSAGCNVTFNNNTQFSVDNTAYFLAQIQGTRTYPAGSYRALLSFDTAVPADDDSSSPVASGFDYLIFNESIANQNFNVTMSDSINFHGSNGGIAIEYYLNGNHKYSFYHSATPSFQLAIDSETFNTDLDFGDVFFGLYSLGANVTANITGAEIELVSTAIKVYDLKRTDFALVTGIPNPSTAYNIDDLTPKRMLKRHGNWIQGALYQQRDQQLTYLSLDKNESLNTLDHLGNTINERANEEISLLGKPLFYPYIFEFDTRVPDGFADLMENSVNAHIQFEYNGISFWGFPVRVSVKPALNDSQNWQLLASPINKLTTLIDLSTSGINYLQLMQYGMTAAHLNPVQFVPLNTVFDSRYNFRHQDQDWFINRINDWSSQRNYYQKWQNNDTVSLQVITNGLGPVQIDVIDCTGKTIIPGIVMNVIPSASVANPYILYQADISLASLSHNVYYFIISGGIGGTIAQFISEGQEVAVQQPDTVLLEYTNTKNKQTMIFDQGFKPSMRVEGKLIRFNPGMNLTSYEDEPADEFVLNGIPFRKYTFVIGGGGTGIPDFVIDKINRIFGLNTVLIDGLEYVRSGDAAFERVSFPGSPLEFWSIELRQAKADEGVTVSADGLLEANLFAVYNLDTKLFGDFSSQASSNIVQVEKLDD
jgi:hypothetical protein